MMKRCLPLIPLLLAGCAIKDSHLAESAPSRLMGMSEVELESCLGSPDEHSTFGNTDVLTYYATSSSSTSYSIPVIGGIGFSNGGYCHATFQVQNGRVTQLLYSGEKNATLAPDAYCAPIMRTCLDHLDQMTTAGNVPASAQGATQGGSTPAQPRPQPNTAAPPQSTPPGAGAPAAAP
jgi:hypothetical protein